MITLPAKKVKGRWYVDAWWLYFKPFRLKRWLKTPMPFTSRGAIEKYLKATRGMFKDENKAIKGVKQISGKYIKKGRAICHS